MQSAFCRFNRYGLISAPTHKLTQDISRLLYYKMKCEFIFSFYLPLAPGWKWSSSADCPGVVGWFLTLQVAQWHSWCPRLNWPLHDRRFKHHAHCAGDPLTCMFQICPCSSTPDSNDHTSELNLSISHLFESGVLQQGNIWSLARGFPGPGLHRDQDDERLMNPKTFVPE